MRTRVHVLAAALALTFAAVAGAGDPGPGDPIDPPLTPKPVATTSSSSSASGKATLALVSSTPLRLKGAGFRAHELVRLTVTTSSRQIVRQLRTGLKGGFAVVFTTVRFDRCSSPVPAIVARAGSSGRIALSVKPPECAMG
jgi:hypothetical protein